MIKKYFLYNDEPISLVFSEDEESLKKELSNLEGAKYNEISYEDFVTFVNQASEKKQEELKIYQEKKSKLKEALANLGIDKELLEVL
jgi:chromosome condensin MukBEF complex kleisin-like MukF subunit